ncbi:hypothetical protein NEHOM01_1252 [Nematocida homosporus]|uniref:uncharacterized protein n=1 Tax=Nematocida homosporus TaxID=1912981 RepID=UPI00221ECBFF|nr:uncharacterized protein NEHOM01_1252 [Nematocida homosporus]KAI5186049.1 hypothetical protein NEHOM01_1252 [Nematocida homosporus]
MVITEMARNRNRKKKISLVFGCVVLLVLLTILGLINFRRRVVRKKVHTHIYGVKDQNLYESMKLTNGMRVVVISNPMATQAAAALSVGAGLSNDPVEHLGLAHLLEHMLVMGSDKYPEEDYYVNWIRSKGGRYRAQTTLFETKYFHALPAEYGKEALSILSRFFIEPRMSETVLDREKKVVDSEMKRNLTDQNTRRLVLMSNFIKKTHPMSKFNIGSEKTLAKTTRADLMSFWKYHYTPRNMTLAIFGKESLEELKGYATEFFSDVKEYTEAKWEFSGEPTLIKPTTKRDPFDKSYDIGTKETSGKIVYYRPNESKESSTRLTIYIFLPAMRLAYREQTLHFLIKMLENGNKGSLNSILLKNNVTSSGDVFAQMERDSTYFAVYYTLIDATPEKIASVLNLIEGYLKMIKENATEKLYQKYARLMQNQKQCITPDDQLQTTIQIATSLPYRKLKDVFTGDYDWTSFNKEDFGFILSIMMDRSNWLVMVETSTLFLGKPLLSDQHFGLKYFVEKVSNVTDADIDALQSQLAWVTTDFGEEVDFSTARGQNVSYALGTAFKNIKEYEMPSDKDIEHFSITEDGFEAHLIHKQDIRSKEAYLTLCLGCIDIYKNISAYVSFIGYAEAFTSNFLLAHKEDMQMSGVSLKPIVEDFGAALLTFTGNPLALEDLIRIFLKEFNEQKEELLIQTSNMAMAKYDALKHESPSNRLFLGLIRSKNRYTYLDEEECIEVAHDLTINEFFSITEADIKLYAIGNLTQSEFTRICQLIKDTIKPNTQKKLDLEGPLLNHVDVAIQDQENIALLISHEITKFTPVKNLVVADLIGQAMSSKFIDELQTKKGPGYVAQMNSRTLFSQSHLNWLVQANSPYEKIQTEILQFIAGLSAAFQRLSPAEFDTIKQALIATYQQKASNAQEYINIHLNFWRFHGFDLGHCDELVKIVTTITKDELANYCATEIVKSITAVLASNKVTTTLCLP